MDSPTLGLQIRGVQPGAAFNPESLRRAGNASAPDKTKEVRKSANEFETSLVAAWWKEMESTVHAFSGEEQDSEAEAFGDLGAQALASAIVARGGFGIAKLLINKMVPKDSGVTAAAAEGATGPVSRKNIGGS